MPSYRAPGIYIQEEDTGTRPIEAAGTTTAGFVGSAPKADVNVNTAVAVDSFDAFARDYIGDAKTGTPLANAVYAFFRNGGSRCYIVNIPDGSAIAGGGRGLDQFTALDEIAMIAAPGRTDPASYDALLTAAELLGDRVGILDGPERVEDTEQLTRTSEVAGETPAAPASAAGSAPPAPTGPAGRRALRPRGSDRGYGAFYFPWIRMRDAVDPSRIVSVPPSGHIAGICARTDVERGVHKAPANVLVREALGLTQAVTKAQQAELNPAGVNCLRSMPDGVVVWGARTLAPAASNWRYLNVRRLFIMIEESIVRSTRWIVFEPNDRPLWQQVRRDLTAFLTILWRQGALMGVTPAQAFFVKCDETTNPPEVIDAGQVVVVVGIAPVKPAEFVIFRIGQSAAGTAVEAA
jgi:phage tail sheath protein FI